MGSVSEGSTWALLTWGLGESLLRTVLSTVKCLAASLASIHEVPVAMPSHDNPEWLQILGGKSASSWKALVHPLCVSGQVTRPSSYVSPLHTEPQIPVQLGGVCGHPAKAIC